MASVGKKYSTWVYIVHPIFITVLAVGTRRFVIYDAYQYVAPFVIYFVSICFVAIMRGMIKYVQNSVHEPS